MFLYDKVVSFPHIIYELPMSKVIQAVKNSQNIEKSWQAVMYFLQNVTNATPQPKDIVLNIDENKEERDTILWKSLILEKYGEPTKIHFDTMYHQLKWHLNDINEAVTFYTSLPKPPSAIRPYLSLTVVYKFEFIDIFTKEVLKNANNQPAEFPSTLTIFLERNSQLMAEFIFPFDNVVDFKLYLAEIEPFLPFKKLDTKAFRLVYPNKKGTANVVKKILI